VYSIQEGNAALPRKLAAAAKLPALHLGTAVQAIQRDTASGQYTLLAVQQPAGTASDSASNADQSKSVTAKHTEKELTNQQDQQTKQQQQQTGKLSITEFGPFDGVVLATPLEGSAIELQEVLPPGDVLPKREYQSTVTTYVTGALNPSYFKVRCQPGE
jgi:hypothetical protein